MHTIWPASSPCTSLPWNDAPPAIAWERLLGRFADLFTRLSEALFTILIGAWVLCPGRRTVTRMIGIGDPDGVHAHGAYHRFRRAGAWTMARLWCQLVRLLLAHLDLDERLVLDLDDTLFHKCGRKVNGAGSFPDPIRSRGQQIVFARGLNGSSSPCASGRPGALNRWAYPSTCACIGRADRPCSISARP